MIAMVPADQSSALSNPTCKPKNSLASPKITIAVKAPKTTLGKRTAISSDTG